MNFLLDNISDFFSGKSKAPANPDPVYNILLLSEIKRKIETNIFTRLLKRPTIYIAEIITYLVTALLFIGALVFWGKLDNFFDGLDFVNFLSKIFNFESITAPLSDYFWISYCLLFILLLPSIICFLLGRLLTSSRKKMKAFIEVENMIDRIIYNLSDNK